MLFVTDKVLNDLHPQSGEPVSPFPPPTPQDNTPILMSYRVKNESYCPGVHPCVWVSFTHLVQYGQLRCMAKNYSFPRCQR